MKILIYNWKDIKNPKAGGAEIVSFKIAKRLKVAGHQVSWFCRSYPGSKEYEEIEGIKIFRKGGVLSTYFYGWRFYQKLYLKPDVVIDMINTLCWQTPLYTKKSKIIVYLNQLAKEVFLFQLPWPLSIIGYKLEHLQYMFYKSAKVPFICFSNGTQSDLEKMDIAPNNIYQFPLGLDHQRYKVGPKSKKPLFLCISRLVKMKRNDLVISAFSLIVKKYPEAQLVIMGNGPEEPNLQKLVKKLKLVKQVKFIFKDNFSFLKNVSDPKTYLMQQAWALVFPSVKEGWGMTVTECAACGTPAIVTNVTGLRDAVIKNKTGLMVSSKPTPQELAQMMEQIVINEKLRKNLSKNAVRFANKFSWEQSMEKFIKLFNLITSYIPHKVNKNKLPFVSIVMPTLNAARTLSECLGSIAKQKYPKGKIELVFADAGSVDGTLDIIQKFKIQNSDLKIKLIPNKLKTGEAGKAIAIKHAQGELIALIDSDNILDNNDWLLRMVQPFADRKIIGSEPLFFTRRSTDSYITRYCAMMGMGDPLVLFTGNYDRYSLITKKWTGMNIYQEDRGDYLVINLKAPNIPTIGANGTILRRELFNFKKIGDYLFDIDLLYELSLLKTLKFAKVKIGITHIFSGNISTFIRKQNRRIKDFLYYQKTGLRTYPWQQLNKLGLIKFIFYCLIILPLFGQSLLGFIRKKDIAWLFHPLACWITLITYGLGKIQGIHKTQIADRSKWSQ